MVLYALFVERTLDEDPVSPARKPNAVHLAGRELRDPDRLVNRSAPPTRGAREPATVEFTDQG